MKESQKRPTFQPSVKPAEALSSFTLSEALEVLRHLDARNILCTGCGYRIVEHVNQMHSHCNECKRPNMNYSPSPKGSPFERILCNRLQDWVNTHVLGAESKG
jgi:hypothetical protein